MDSWWLSPQSVPVVTTALVAHTWFCTGLTLAAGAQAESSQREALLFDPLVALQAQVTQSCWVFLCENCPLLPFPSRAAPAPTFPARNGTAGLLAQLLLLPFNAILEGAGFCARCWGPLGAGWHPVKTPPHLVTSPLRPGRLRAASGLQSSMACSFPQAGPDSPAYQNMPAQLWSENNLLS